MRSFIAAAFAAVVAAEHIYPEFDPESRSEAVTTELVGADDTTATKNTADFSLNLKTEFANDEEKQMRRILIGELTYVTKTVGDGTALKTGFLFKRVSADEDAKEDSATGWDGLLVSFDFVNAAGVADIVYTG